MKNQQILAYTTSRSDIFDLIPTQANVILDVGCSNGTLGHSLKNNRPERKIYGIEFDNKFAREAGEHLDFVINADLNLFDWQKAFNDQKFDCIIFADVLEHLVEPESCLLQARQYLQQGGCIVVSLPNIRHISALSAIFLKGSFPRRDRGIFDRTHLRWFTVADAHNLLTSAGFTISASSLALRFGDRGGGFLNRLLNRLPLRVKEWAPIREFFTYQICLQAKVNS